MTPKVRMKVLQHITLSDEPARRGRIDVQALRKCGATRGRSTACDRIRQAAAKSGFAKAARHTKTVPPAMSRSACIRSRCTSREHRIPQSALPLRAAVSTSDTYKGDVLRYGTAG